MFPYLIESEFIKISNFWLSITIWFFMFIWMLFKMSKRLDYDFNIFKNNIIWFFISIFFFSRLFYVISKWYDYKNIVNPIYFFIANDYNFLLMWWLFWFFLVLFIILKIRKENLDKYILWIAISFVFALPIWFFWALLWWQVYWIETNLWIEIISRDNSAVPSTSPLFPLPIFYSILFFILFCWIYIINMYIKEKNILWYASFMIFSCIIFIMEFLSGKSDLLKDFIFINLSQIFAIILFSVCFYKIHKIYKIETKNE